MIPTTCKRLIEVDFPIAAVSAHSAREKSGPQGHISTIHLWWARRPLAACRAVLLGLLLPDPCDKDCPAAFKTTARELLAKRYGSASKSNEELRELLLKFIGEFANWDNAANAMYLEIGRGLVKAAHLPAPPAGGHGGEAGPYEPPVVVDPFAGGGSIPLEALRLGCEAFASDLNPVACLILKTLLEDIPRYGNAEFKLKDDKGKDIVVHGLADALRYVGKQVKAAAEKELAKFYPPDPDGSHPIAYIWARTVRCEGIGCGAEIPLVRALWLCKKDIRKRALRYRVERTKIEPPRIVFEIFEPQNENEIPHGTVTRANATCPCCNVVLPAARVRSQLSAHRGGADVQFDLKGNRIGGALLLAVVTLHHKTTGRFYRLPTSKDYAAVYEAQNAVEKQPKGVVPDERLPLMSGTFNVPLYGITAWGDMFTSRQKVALLVWQELLKALRETHAQDCLLTAMSLALSRVTMCGMSLTNWNAYAEKMQHTFGRQALPMVWDFAEVVSTAHAPGAWQNALDLICEVVSKFPQTPVVGQVQQTDACESPLSKGACDVWFTDPPYYFAVPYADLSDFFFVWLKRTLPNHPLLGDPFDKRNPLTPKDRELCQMAHWDSERYAHKDQTFFEDGMARAFAEGRRVLKEDGICCVVFAHKTTEGWEALLSGIIRGGWTITASWPISTEMASRLRARDSAALAGSVHLVCRPRPIDAGVGDWTEVKAAMEKRIREWLPTLVKHGVRGADAIFSCLGPALESYSRYEKVLTAADREVPLGGLSADKAGDPHAEPHERGFLAYVFETLSKEALHQVLGDAETEGFEEDSRMTALFLWTLQATKANGNGRGSKVEGREPEDVEEENEDEDDSGKPNLPAGKAGKAKAGFSMPFDTFIRITRPMGIHYAALEHRVIEIEKGIVRLLPVRERSEQLLGDLPAAWQAGAATRPGIEITLEDVKQMELGLATQRREETELMSKPKRGRRSAAGLPATGKVTAEVEFTTLDRLHRAMLLFGLGRSTLLRQVLETELRQSKRFERLALALNALYPENSDERRMLEGVQAAMRGVR